MVSGTTSGFGRNQIYLKLKLGAIQFMPGIKNWNLIFFLIFFLNFKQKKFTKKTSQKKLSNFNLWPYWPFLVCSNIW
jgi:hypothetical protein